MKQQIMKQSIIGFKFCCIH